MEGNREGGRVKEREGNREGGSVTGRERRVSLTYRVLGTTQFSKDLDQI